MRDFLIKFEKIQKYIKMLISFVASLLDFHTFIVYRLRLYAYLYIKHPFVVIIIIASLTLT